MAGVNFVQMIAFISIQTLGLVMENPCVCVCVLVAHCVQLFATPWTIAHQAPLSMEFSRQEYGRG